MQDRVPLYPGRVKLTPVSGQENTYDMVRADEPTQEGTPLSKATFLKDDTAALFGLDATAVPDDALAVLSRFQSGLGNEYVWSRYKSEQELQYDEETQQYYPQFSSNKTIYYSDSFTVKNGRIILTDPKSFVANSVSACNVAKGKYTSANATYQDLSYIYFVPDTATFTFSTPGVYICDFGTRIYNASVVKRIVDLSYVNSPDPNAYPIDDGYTYAALGQLGNKAQIATGSYIGTGKYDTGNKNVISLPFDPKLVIVGKKDYGLTPQSSGGSNGGWLESFLWYIGLEKARSYRASSNNYGFVYFTNTTRSFTWYSSETVEMQCNVSGTTYYYIAIG